MRFSTRANRLFAAALPLGVALLVAGTVLLIARDEGTWLLIAGFLLLIGGLAGAHAVLARRYGGVGLAGFLLTQASFLLIALYGIGFLTLAVASPLLAYALLRMRPQLRLSAVALLAVWPVAVGLAVLTPLEFIESLATVFPLPYAPLAVEVLRLPE